MSKILFTGASGFIGSHFHEVINNSDIINFDLIAPKFENSSLFWRGDIRNRKDVRGVLRSNFNDIDCIISLAAEHKDFGLSRQEYFSTNETGTQNLCEAATEFNIKKIIFYSSVAVYGNNNSASHELLSPNPSNHYGSSKLAGEKIMMDWAMEDNSRSVLIIRPTVVYGERNVANMFRLIQQISNGRYFNIGRGNNIKSIAYVKNLVGATIWLKDRLKPGIEIYNYADEPQLTSREISANIAKALNRSDALTLPYWLVYLLALPFDLLIKLTGKDLAVSTNRVRKFCTQTYHKADKLQKAGFLPNYSTIDGLTNMVKWQSGEYDSSKSYFNV